MLRGFCSVGLLTVLGFTSNPGHAHDVAPPAPSEVAVASVSAQEGRPTQEIPVEETYRRQCAACHGERGRGDGRMARRFKPPPADFQDPNGVAKLTDEQLIEIITDGRASMPAFGDVLNEEVVATVVTYVRGLSRGSER